MLIAFFLPSFFYYVLVNVDATIFAKVRFFAGLSLFSFQICYVVVPTVQLLTNHLFDLHVHVQAFLLAVVRWSAERVPMGTAYRDASMR